MNNDISWKFLGVTLLVMIFLVIFLEVENNRKTLSNNHIKQNSLNEETTTQTEYVESISKQQIQEGAR